MKGESITRFLWSAAVAVLVIAGPAGAAATIPPVDESQAVGSPYWAIVTNVTDSTISTIDWVLLA